MTQTIAFVTDDASFDGVVALIERANANIRAFRKEHGSLPDTLENFLKREDFGSDLVSIESGAGAAGTNDICISFKPTKLLLDFAAATTTADFDNFVIE